MAGLEMVQNRAKKNWAQFAYFPLISPNPESFWEAKGEKTSLKALNQHLWHCLPRPPPQKLEGLIFWGLFSTPPHEIWDELVGFGVNQWDLG